MAPHSSTLAWRIPWMEEPGRLQSMGSLRVGHNWATSLSLFTFMHWRRKRQPTPVFLPGESQGQRSLLGCYGVAQSRTRLTWPSSSSSSSMKEKNGTPETSLCLTWTSTGFNQVSLWPCLVLNSSAPVVIIVVFGGTYHVGFCSLLSEMEAHWW